MGAQARGKSETLEVAIVGAGATGVELAAELRDAARQFSAYGLDKISPENLKITLIEAGPRVLPALPERVSLPVAERLVHEGVRVMCGSAVTLVDEEGLQLANGIKVAARLKVWAAGIRAPVFLASLGNLKTNRINQLEVSETLQTTQDPNIFAFGDCAACPNGHSGTNVPQGTGRSSAGSLPCAGDYPPYRGRPLPSFTYRDYGSLVSLSREGAVGTLMGNLMGSFKVEGWLAGCSTSHCIACTRGACSVHAGWLRACWQTHWDGVRSLASSCIDAGELRGGAASQQFQRKEL